MEQVAICLRHVNENFEPHEDFVGLHAVDSIKPNVLVGAFKDTMLRMNQSMSDCEVSVMIGQSIYVDRKMVQQLR